MDPFTQLDAITPELRRLVAGTRTAQLADATPCDKWAVRDLLAHLVDGLRMFGEAFGGAPVRDISQPDPAVLGDDPTASLTASIAAFDAATRAPGATDVTLTLPFGDVPGEVFMRLAAFDLTVHCWDVATATGQRVNLPAEVVTAGDAFARQALTADVRATGMFGAEVAAPDGASPLESLVAFAGRQP